MWKTHPSPASAAFVWRGFNSLGNNPIQDLAPA